MMFYLVLEKKQLNFIKEGNMNLKVCPTTNIEYFDSNISYGGNKFFDKNNIMI